jgi:hypothetical protein
MTKKKKVVVVGNCQARPIATLLEAMSDEIEVTKVAIVHLLKSEQEAEYKPFFEEADYIIAQLVAPNYPCDFVRSDNLKKAYGNKVISIVNLFFKGYHPDWTYLKTLKKENLKGPMQDYHNLVIFNGWKDNVDISTIKNKLLSLDYYNLHYKNSVKESLFELKNREKNADVSICNFIQENLLVEQLFFTFNHPSLILLKEYSKRILFRLNIFPCTIEISIPSEPLDQIIIDSAPNIKDLKTGVYKGVEFEFDDNNEFSVLGGLEYNTLNLVSSFYEFYNINADELKKLPVLNIEKGVLVKGNKKELFIINGIELKADLITERLVNDLIAQYISSGREDNINIDFSPILQCNLLTERIRAKFLVLYIEKSRGGESYNELIDLIINERKYIKFPFLSAIICDVVFNNINKLENINTKTLNKLISILSSSVTSLNKLKVLSVDNNNQFKILKSYLISYCDKTSENENVILFNAYLSYKDFKSYYLDKIPKISFKIGENDENYLATLLKLFRKLGWEFELSLLERFIQSKHFLVVDLILSQSNNSQKYTKFITENKNISIEDKFLLSRLYYTGVNNSHYNEQKIYPKETFSIKSKPRLAVCISGQLRGYKETFEDINNALNEHFDFDVYISTWSNVGCRMPYPLIAADRVFVGQFLTEFKKVISSGELSWGDFQKMYPSVIELIASQNNIDKEFIYKAFSSAGSIHLDIEDENEKSMESNQSKMFYKIEKCYNMLEEISAQIENDYDFILRIRPDRKVVAADIKSMIGRIDDNTLYVDHPSRLHFFKGLTVGDTLAFGTPQMMKMYSTFYSKTLRENIIIRAHNELAYHLYYNGISIKRSAIQPLGFYNPIVADKDILSALTADSKLRENEIDKLLLNSLNNSVN